MKLQAVIGANYGDEGKGLVTDYLSSPTSLVVRFNGGAQAGHTVVTDHRRVFSHIGSGTLQRADTFLSRFFIVNPLEFYLERRKLVGDGFQTDVFIDPRCLVTTPIDMMLNQAVEAARGEKRHGSCGLGINETVHRNIDPRFQITVGDAHDRRVSESLRRIKEEYLPLRLEELGIKELLPNAKANLDEVLEAFAIRFRELPELCEVTKFENAWNMGHEKIIFEGAQGLCLDMDGPDFPHVTRSKTGLHNVLILMNEAGLRKEDLDAFFVTRTYLTRHGAGPLPSEVSSPPYPGIVDETNVHNQWQGTIRYGLLDVLRLADRIKKDAGEGLRSFNVVLTCVDQIRDGPIKTVPGGRQSTIELNEFCILMKSYGAKNVFFSRGPTRKDVVKV